MAYQRTTLRMALAFALGLFACALTFSTPANACENFAKDRPEASDVTSCPPSEPGRHNQPEQLLNLIVTWLSTNFDLPANYDHPMVEVVAAERIATLRFGSAGLRGPRDVVAVYHDKRRTIYLSEGWTGKSPAELSVLVHEMVHHLQNLGKQFFFCPEAREKPAYDAQELWLRMFGKSLASEFEIDPFTLKVATGCM